MVRIINSFGTALQKFLGFSAKEQQTIYSGYSGSNYVGTVCKILDYENKQYFLGKIEAYDAKYNELKIGPYRMESIPVTVKYNTPVKLQIQKGEHLTLVYGTARKQDKECWRVTLDDVQQCEEQREGFRQPLKGQIMVTRPLREKQTTCDLVDISLTGICIKSKEDMELGEHIIIHDVALYAGAVKKHTFVCDVRRIFGRGPNNEVINIVPAPTRAAKTEDSNQERIVIESLDSPQHPQSLQFEEKYYGCSFFALSQEEKEQIYKEMFMIQQRERNMY